MCKDLRRRPNIRPGAKICKSSGSVANGNATAKRNGRDHVSPHLTFGILVHGRSQRTPLQGLRGWNQADRVYLLHPCGSSETTIQYRILNRDKGDGGDKNKTSLPSP